MRVLLIAGGWSGEREVSLSGARQIAKALESLGHNPDFFDLSLGFPELLKRAGRADFAFINLHGSPGEDGLVQALLETTGTPFQGSGPAGSFLALNKGASKSVFQAAGIPTPPWELVTESPTKSGADPAKWAAEFPLELPVFVKPNMGGSSIGMGLVRTEAELVPALDTVFDLGEEALVESYMAGEELTCGVLGETPLPLILIKPKAGSVFFDYANKYDADGAEEICPAPVGQDIVDLLQALALRAHHILGLTGYSRADFIWTANGPFLLEVNTLPGMTPTSLLPRAAKAHGMSFEDLIAELIRLGMEGR